MRKVTKFLGEESSVVGYVFSRSEFPTELPRDLESILGIAETLINDGKVSLSAYYGGLGLPFCECPNVVVGKYKILVTQFFGWDI